jgi:hypothetical protein
MPPRAQPGAPLQVSAEAYNYLVDQFAKANGGGFRSSLLPPKARDNRILIKNTFRTTLDRFSIVAFADPLVVPETDDSEFFETYCLNAINADQVSTITTTFNWGITQEPISLNEIGECLVSGITAVKINAPTGTGDRLFAKPSGLTDRLNPAVCGMCRILWRKAGTGPQWALVNLG